MTEKQLVKKSKYFSYNDIRNAKQFIVALSELIEELEEEEGSCDFELDIISDEKLELQLIYSQLETDAEMKSRIEKEALIAIRRVEDTQRLTNRLEVEIQDRISALARIGLKYKCEKVQ